MPLNRQTVWMSRCGCKYDYGSVSVKPIPFNSTVEDITAYIFEKLQMPLPDAVNINYYTDGLQMVGWHSDDESLFKSDDVRIYSLSLGATREFQLVRKDLLRTSGKFRRHVEPRGLDITKVDLEDGAVLGMAGNTQAYYDHRIRQTSAHAGPRINLTWRYITYHLRNCPCSS